MSLRGCPCPGISVFELREQVRVEVLAGAQWNFMRFAEKD